MKPRLILAACLVLVLLPSRLLADETISFDDGYPKGGAGKVTGVGTFTIDAGVTLSKITLFATNPQGGQGGQVDCMYNQTKKTWSGTISGLPAGTYTVYAQMKYVANGTTMYVDTKHVTGVKVT